MAQEANETSNFALAIFFCEIARSERAFFACRALFARDFLQSFDKFMSFVSENARV